MAAWCTARASCGWTAAAVCAVFTVPRTMARCRACCTISEACAVRNPDVRSRPSHCQCRAERHRGGTADLGLHTDPPQAHPGAPQSDAGRFHHIVSLSDLLHHLPRPGRLGSLPENRPDQDSVLK